LGSPHSDFTFIEKQQATMYQNFMSARLENPNFVIHVYYSSLVLVYARQAAI
jgi:hypothetical protein